MTEPYFSVSKNLSRLKEASRTWVGTPFHARGVVKGPNGGVNCSGLIYGIALEIGLVKEGEINLPDSPIAWNEHHEYSLLNEFFRSPQVRGRVKRIDIKDGLIDGDLLALKVKKTEHHLCWLLGPDHVIHCNRKKGVMESSIIDISQYIGGAYRIYK